MDKISVIVPIYNASKYLDECLVSIVNQTYENLEIILIDDGSLDNSGDICKKWQQKDKRIKYTYQKNQGVSVARNNGIEKSSGKYIIFVDADDYLMPQMVDQLHKLILKFDTNIAICDYYEINSNSQREKNYFDKTKIINVHENKKDLLEKTIQSLGVPWGKIFNAEFLKSNRIMFKVGLKRMQDTIFTLEAFELCDCIGYLHLPLYNYRAFDNSATHKYSPNFQETAMSVLHYLNEYLIKNNLWKKYNYIYYTKKFLLLIETIKLKYVPIENDLTYIKKISEIKSLTRSFDIDYKLVKKSFLNKKNQVALFLLKSEQYNLLYFLYKINYRIKNRKYFH